MLLALLFLLFLLFGKGFFVVYYNFIVYKLKTDKIITFTTHAKFIYFQ